MKLFRRSGTWGEGISTIATSWGTIDMTWAGYFIPIGSYKYLGSIVFYANPSTDIEFDNTPLSPLTYIDAPSTDVQEV